MLMIYSSSQVKSGGSFGRRCGNFLEVGANHVDLSGSIVALVNGASHAVIVGDQLCSMTVGFGNFGAFVTVFNRYVLLFIF